MTFQYSYVVTAKCHLPFHVVTVTCLYPAHVVRATRNSNLFMLSARLANLAMLCCNCNMSHDYCMINAIQNTKTPISSTYRYNFATKLQGCYQIICTSGATCIPALEACPTSSPIQSPARHQWQRL